MFTHFQAKPICGWNIGLDMGDIERRFAQGIQRKNNDVTNASSGA
jgi:hypothetical protein